MARNETFVNAPRDIVWSVLCDPYAYPAWVVGTDRTLDADDSFPAPDTAFKVRFPLGLHTDLTHSRHIEENRRIVLDTAGGPWGAARVDIRIADEGEGTRVTIEESPTGVLAPLNALPPVHWAIYLRNIESLRRFRSICEKRAATRASRAPRPQPTGR